MSNGFFSFFYNLFSTSHSQNTDAESPHISGSDFGGVFEDSPGINPATGLPMISSGGVDVAGNPYGIDLSDNFSSTGSTDICDDSLTSSTHSDYWDSSNCSSHNDFWDSSNSSSSFSDWNSGSSFDDNW